MNPKIRRNLVILLTIALVPALAACVSRSTYPPSGFIDTTSGLTDSQRDDKFEREWVSDDVARVKLIRSLRKVQIRPLNLDFLTDKDKHDSEDLKELQTSFKEAFEKRLGETHTIVPATARAGSDTLVIEAALAKIYSPNRLLNVLTSLLIGPITNGGGAFEARLVDAGSRKPVAKIAEEQKGAWHFGSLVIGGYLKYYDTKAVFGAWAKRLANWLNEES